MNRLPGPTARLARHVALLLSLGFSAGPLAAQPKLEITSPKTGDVVYSGRILNVQVAASPAGAFQFVSLLVDLPVEIQKPLTAPPYKFAIQIPPDTESRRFTLMALGVAGPRQAAKSAPISIKVERPDSPQQLKAESSTLNFHYVGDDARLRVYGSFADGSEVDLTYSSLLMYSSEAPTIATVDRNGEVTSVAPGRTKITIRYKDKTIQVPVEVPQPVRILPESSSLYPSQTEHFYAHVAMPPGVDTSVTWSLNPPLGSIDSAGLYTAPASIGSVQSVTLTATSLADPTKSASAQIWLFPPISVTVTPASAALAASESQKFTAKVAYAALKAVKWSVAPAGMGTIDRAGIYTAPAVILRGQSAIVTATSVADTSKTASARVTLLP